MRRRIFKGVIGLLGLAVVLGVVVGLNALSGPAIGTACALPGTEGNGPNLVRVPSDFGREEVRTCRTYRVDEPVRSVSPHTGLGVMISVVSADGPTARLRAAFDDGHAFVFPVYAGTEPVVLQSDLVLSGFSGIVSGRYALASSWRAPQFMPVSDEWLFDAGVSDAWQPEYELQWSMAPVPYRVNRHGPSLFASSPGAATAFVDLSTRDPSADFRATLRLYDQVEFVGIGTFTLTSVYAVPEPSRFSEERYVVGCSSGEATIRFVTDPALLPH